MPIQTARDRFVQFIFDPDYLQPKKYHVLKTDPGPVCHAIGVTPMQVPLKLDGGNVIRGRSWVILTDKVFEENPERSRTEVLSLLEDALEVKPIIIPREPGDFTGHADGIIRMYDEATVLINDYPSRYRPDFQLALRAALQKESLRTIPIPWAVSEVHGSDDVSGLFINFLQMKDFILVPTYDLPEDDVALKTFETLFPDHRVASIESREIAAHGGALNCISWKRLM